jgi:hypothetical protein
LIPPEEGWKSDRHELISLNHAAVDRDSKASGLMGLKRARSPDLRVPHVASRYEATVDLNLNLDGQKLNGWSMDH